MGLLIYACSFVRFNELNFPHYDFVVDKGKNRSHFYSVPNQANAPTTIASTPFFIVGSGSGVNFGL